MTTNPTPPTTDTRPDVVELLRLLDAAPAGRWTLDAWYVVAKIPGARPGGEVIVDVSPTVYRLRDAYDRCETAALIAALRNAAPWLLAQAAAVARVEALLDCGQLKDPGCCSTCEGTGRSYDESTGGMCSDCYATGHNHGPVEAADLGAFLDAIRAALAGPGVSE